MSNGLLIQVSNTPDQTVIDARYFRARAQWCLDLASQLSDAEAAAKLRRDAADYHQRAQNLEGGDQSERGMREPRAPGEGGHG